MRLTESKLQKMEKREREREGIIVGGSGTFAINAGVRYVSRLGTLVAPVGSVDEISRSFSWTQKRQDAAFFPGDHMIFFILNVIEAIGVLMTFKPFLVERQNP